MRKFTQMVKLLSLAVLCMASLLAHAQKGALDTAYYRNMAVDYKCTGGLVLPDNKVMIIGRFAYVHDRLINGIERLNSDGTNDYSFNPGTGADEHVNVLVRQADGKMIIGGDFKKYNGVTVNHICRIMPDGALDPTFVVGTGLTAATGTVYAMMLQPDGKVLVGGIFSTYNGTAANNFIRLNSDGSIDNTFNMGTGFNSAIYSIDLLANDQMIIAGNFTSFNGDATAIRIIKLNPNGSRDASFATQFGPNNIVTAALHLPNGKIVAAGFFTTYDTVSANRIVRLNPNGTIDLTFSVGSGFNNNVNELAIQPDGKILATGGFTTYKGTGATRIVRLDSVGTKDPSFYIGTGLNLSANTVFLGENNNIYVGGTFTTVDSFAKQRLVRLYPTGKMDPTFMRETKLNNQVLAVAYQSTGKALIGGQFTRYNEVMANRIARLNLDGTVDQTFLQGIGANGIIRTIYVQPDDKILIGGDFTTYNGVARNRIARLNADGTLDNTFVIGTGAAGPVYKIVPSPDGGFYIGGSFTTYSGTARARIAKLNSNGTLDVSFAPGTGFTNGLVSDIAIQTNGNIIAGGTFTLYAGTTVNRIARISPTGIIDGTFNTGGANANNNINAVAIQTDGKILIGGTFTTFNGIAKNRIARLNTDGSLDASFIASFNNAVNDILFIENRVYAFGAFTTSNSVAKLRFTMLALDGTNDTSFYVGAGAGNTINAAAYNSEHKKIYIGGNFGLVQNRVRANFAALNSTAIIATYLPTPLCYGAISFARYNKTTTFSSSNFFAVQLSDSSGKFNNPIVIGSSSTNTTGSDSIEILIPNNIPYSNNYYIRIVASNPNDTSNIYGPISIQLPVVPTVSAGGPTAICPGQSVTLTSSPSLSYLWSNGATTQSITADSTQSYTVTTNAYNCSATSAPIAVSTNNIPDSAIVTTAGSFCNGGSIMLTAASNNRYLWSTGDTTQSITVNQSGNYTLVITSPANCIADSTVNIDFSTLGNYLIVENGPTTFCQGGSVTLTSVPNVTYLWSNNATTQSIVVTQAGTYKVTVTDANNCTLSSNTKAVVVNPNPNATLAPSGPTTFCQGDSVTLSAANGLTYSWNNGSTSQAITTSASGFFNVTVTDAATSCTAVSNTISVNVNTNPIASLSLPQDTLCNNASAIQLTGASPAGGVYSGSGVSGTSFNPSAQNGLVTITYTYTDANNCSATASDIIAVDICTGIEDIDASLISIYPNPATSVLNIATGGQTIGRVSISDLTGKVIMDEVPQTSTGTFTLNIGYLAAGTYIVSIDNAKSRFVKTN